MRVDIWTDVICPWCYIGKRRFESALGRFPHRDQVEVVHRSFQLDPHAPQGQTTPTREMLMERYGMTQVQADAMEAQMEQRAAADGLEYHLAGTVSGNTTDAHRILHLGKAKGIQDAVLERLYRAHFTEQRSIFDHASLVTLAAEAGLDPDEARRVLEAGTYGDAVQAEYREAQELGARGVPFFLVDGRYGVSGAQPAEVFEQVLDRAWAERKPQIVQVTGDASAEACVDGACAVPGTTAN